MAHDAQHNGPTGQSTATPSSSRTGGAQAGTSSTGAASSDRGMNAPRSVQQADQERGVATSRESGTQAPRGRAGSPSALTANTPLRLMQHMAQDMDRLFEQFGFGRTSSGLSPLSVSLFNDDIWNAPVVASVEQPLWAPQVETFRRGDKIVVRADLPGVRKEDLHVDVQDDVLTLSGERREEHEENRDNYYRSERSYGLFCRAISLPEGVNADDVDARFSDGVLEVTVGAPKEQQQKSKRIQIR